MADNKNKSRYIVCIGFIVIIVIIYVARLIQWQIVDGDIYQSISEKSNTISVTLDSARGEILASDGEVLAGNTTTYNVVMNAITMESDRNVSILKVLNILEENDTEWVDKLPITIDENGDYQFTEDSETEIAKLKSESILNMQDYATAEDCMVALITKYKCEDYSQEDARNIISVRYNMTKTLFSTSDPYTIAEDVSMDIVTLISASESDLPGIEIEISTKRDYGDDSTIAPHIIGTLGAISQDEYDYYEELEMTYSSENISGYTNSDIVGKSGIESAFEDILRGEDGQEVIQTDINGDPASSEVTVAPENGNTVYLTIDYDLQAVANEALAENITLAGEAYDDCEVGAVVVLDVETFGVLAASTYPTYDLDLYQNDSTYYKELINDESSPLYNRAFNGTFTVGSVFKPLVAIAALNEGIINEYSTVNCTGRYTFYDASGPTCMGTHGDVSVIEALQKSCNVFFYDVGRRLTIDTMNVYTELFALGEKTGIEVSEASGLMSNKTDYEATHGTSWVDGLTIQAAIGQCDSAFTPLQLATYCATIANDGTRYETHLLDKITDYTGETVIETYEPVLVVENEINMDVLEIVQEGMYQVTQTGGTAAKTFSDYPVEVAAKTGTAQVSGYTDNTVFIAYAPYDDPEIAVAVILEHGGDGTYSQAVAKAIFDEYFGFNEDDDE